VRMVSMHSASRAVAVSVAVTELKRSERTGPLG
jgi:hypothetical protein